MHGFIPDFCQQQSTVVMDIMYLDMNNECFILGFCHSKFIDQSLVHKVQYIVRIFLRLPEAQTRNVLHFYLKKKVLQ